MKSPDIGAEGDAMGDDVGYVVAGAVGVGVNELSSVLLVGASVGMVVGVAIGNAQRQKSSEEHVPVFEPSRFIFRSPPSR